MNRQFRQDLYNRIEACEENNPKEFWKIVNQMKNNKHDQSADPTVFFEHFKKFKF